MSTGRTGSAKAGYLQSLSIIQAGEAVHKQDMGTISAEYMHVRQCISRLEAGYRQNTGRIGSA